ncbi:hypothetical protein Syn7502_02553 [Synechococcus sp. PCC 7502]|nr:hypothetical protein Syn7502_02553 [Synechococcus sp. PCC 7502]
MTFDYEYLSFRVEEELLEIIAKAVRENATFLDLSGEKIKTITPAIAQTQHTWRIEMLRRGIDHESFQIISGLNRAEILAYDLKVKEYLALQQAIALDKSTKF